MKRSKPDLSAQNPSESLPAPADDPWTTCPVFRPTESEFADLNGYMATIAPEAAEKGLCKIIPPATAYSWTLTTDTIPDDLEVKTPIAQLINGRRGFFSVANVQQKSCSLASFRSLAAHPKHARRPARSTQGPKDAHVKQEAGREGGGCAGRRTLDELDPFAVERMFWKSLNTTSEPAVYGADVPGTAFGRCPGVPWSMAEFPCVMRDAGVRLPGITQPMLYMGMWRSLFAFHTEDVDLYSCNILHAGAPKYWYAVAAGKDAERLEQLARGQWPLEARSCSQFLRHKTKLVSPSVLKANGIPFVRCQQRVGELMVTFPRSYHGGFNGGFNLAEAMNPLPPSLAAAFITRTGLLARVCACTDFSVRVDMKWLLQRVFARPDHAHCAHPPELLAILQELQQRRREEEQVRAAAESKAALEKRASTVAAALLLPFTPPPTPPVPAPSAARASDAARAMRMSAWLASPTEATFLQLPVEEQRAIIAMFNLPFRL